MIIYHLSLYVSYYKIQLSLSDLTNYVIGVFMQLYSFFNSSTSYRVRIALAIKGIAYEYKGVNIRIGEQASPEYLKLNKSKGVPVLIADDEFQLTQSLAVIQYLDDLQPSPLLIPKDPKAKARVLELSNAIACDMHPVNNLKILGYLKNELKITEDQKNAWYQHWVAEGFSAVEALLEKYGEGPYCFGSSPTLADCCLVPQVANALRFNCDLSSFEKVMRVYQHCISQPQFQQAAPKNQPDFSD